MYGSLVNENCCGYEPLIFFYPQSSFSTTECHLGEAGPRIAFETLTLATLGWWLFTTAAAYVCTDREGTASPGVLTLPGPGKSKRGCLMVIPKSTHQAYNNSDSVLAI